MQIQRFRKWGWLYRPVSSIGWFLSALLVVLSGWVILVLDGHSHSVSDTLINAFPYVMLFVILWNWLAAHTAKS